MSETAAAVGTPHYDVNLSHIGCNPVLRCEVRGLPATPLSGSCPSLDITGSMAQTRVDAVAVEVTAGQDDRDVAPNPVARRDSGRTRNGLRRSNTATALVSISGYLVSVWRRTDQSIRRRGPGKPPWVIGYVDGMSNSRRMYGP